MARLYIRSNKYLLQKLDKTYTPAVGMAAIKNLGSKKDAIPSLLGKDDELSKTEDLFAFIAANTSGKDLKLSNDSDFKVVLDAFDSFKNKKLT